MVQDLVFRVLLDVIQLSVIVLGGMAIAYLKKHFTQQQLEKAREVAFTAVQAVEMIAKTYGYDSRQKFEKALSFVKSLAAKHGISLTDQQWQALIEAAVLQLKALGQEIHSGADTGNNA